MQRRALIAGIAAFLGVFLAGSMLVTLLRRADANSSATPSATPSSSPSPRPPSQPEVDAYLAWVPGGLPAGFAVAVAEDDPDRMLFAARNRLYVSTDGGTFWRSLDVELPDVVAAAWLD